mmetsp:Transcript_22499/g.70506  ORF Transcript_22499/g.70506 Transcript_22499/m.70506 type:complete len:242 (+) Transcript_22499:435-1160(+)
MTITSNHFCLFAFTASLTPLSFFAISASRRLRSSAAVGCVSISDTPLNEPHVSYVPARYAKRPSSTSDASTSSARSRSSFVRKTEQMCPLFVHGWPTGQYESKGVRVSMLPASMALRQRSPAARSLRAATAFSRASNNALSRASSSFLSVAFAAYDRGLASAAGSSSPIVGLAPFFSLTSPVSFSSPPFTHAPSDSTTAAAATAASPPVASATRSARSRTARDGRGWSPEPSRRFQLSATA